MTFGVFYISSEWKFTGKPARLKIAESQIYGDRNRRFFSVDLGGITKSSTFINIYESSVISNIYIDSYYFFVIIIYFIGRSVYKIPL